MRSPTVSVGQPVLRPKSALALLLLLWDVLAALAGEYLTLVAHVAEGAHLRRPLLGREELEVFPRVALRAPLEEHLAREGLQAQEVPLA